MKFVKILYPFLLLLLLVLGSANSSFAQENSTTQTHTVQKGETLFSIAQQYGVSVNQIKEWNNLSSNNLRVGQTLDINKSLDSKTTHIHEVKKGETLYSISKQYQVSISSLRKWNELTNDALAVGQEIKIYTSNNPQLEQNVADQSAASTDSTRLIIDDETIQTTYYTVKAGDNLIRIAQKFNMTLAQLKALNDLQSNTIGVGQQLTVRTPRSDVSLVESETSAAAVQGNFRIHTISKKQHPSEIIPEFDMDSTEFAALNPSINWDMPLIAGDQITVLTPAKADSKNPYLLSDIGDTLGSTPVSLYEEGSKGVPTTSGELYNPDQLTAAHASIALGSVIFVENPSNQRGIFVLINDRISDQGLKISSKASSMLGISSGKSTSSTVKIYKQK